MIYTYFCKLKITLQRKLTSKECTKQTLSSKFFSLYFEDTHKPRKSRRREEGSKNPKKLLVIVVIWSTIVGGEGAKNDQKVVYVP